MSSSASPPAAAQTRARSRRSAAAAGVGRASAAQTVAWRPADRHQCAGVDSAAPDGALARPFGSAAAISAPTFCQRRGDRDVAAGRRAVAKQSQNALARAAQAIQALQAVQAAARNAAAVGWSLPRHCRRSWCRTGLLRGGLQVAPGAERQVQPFGRVPICRPSRPAAARPM